MITKKIVLLILCLLFSTSFVLAQDDDMDDLADVKAQIEEMNSAAEEAMLSGNYKSLLQYYTEDVISMPSYQPMIMGKASVKENMMRDANMQMDMTKFDLSTKEVFAEGDLVVEIGTYNLTLKMEGMPEPIDDHGKYLTIYEKQDDGSLKIRVETWNTNINPWEKMGMDKMNGMDHEMKDQDMDNKDKDMEEN